MAEPKAAEVKKKGFFSRKRNAPAPAPATLAVKPAAQPKPAPAPAPAVEVRVSLESMPEVEKRIDRMRATQRRASLLERYENRYGEKLEVPKVFVPLEEVKEEAPAAAEAPKAEASPAPQTVAAPVATKPAAPPLPPREVKPPAAALAPVAAKPAAAAAPAVKPGAPAPKPAAPPKPSKPSPINGKTFWKYLWPYWRLPLRNLAKYYYPDNKGYILGATVADVPIWVILAIPRIVFCPIGLAVTFLKKRKAKQANGDKAEAVVAAN